MLQPGLLTGSQMCDLQPGACVALDARQLRQEAGQVAATALWDEGTAAGLLLFSLPGGAGTALEWCPVKLCWRPACALSAATSVLARRVLLLASANKFGCRRKKVWMWRCLKAHAHCVMHNHHKADQHTGFNLMFVRDRAEQHAEPW